MDGAFGPNGTAGLYNERDLSKQSMCRLKGVTLIDIPFWY
jgi:hypothetical protein